MNTNENRSGLMNSIAQRAWLVVLVVALLALLVLGFGQARSTSGADTLEAQPAAAIPQQESGHSDYLVSLTRKAMANGFGAESVMLLAPERGPGREAVAKELRGMLTQYRLGRATNGSDFKETQYDKRILSFVGERSYLEVYTDGTKVRFRADLDDPKGAAQTGSHRKLDKEALETLGRRFIGDALRSVVKVGGNESLTFLGVRYLHQGGGDEYERKKDDRVIANIAVFGREINGLPVVGSGSKVAVWFTGDREPAGFDVDWPAYRVLQTSQKVLPQDRLKARVEAVTRAPKGSSESRVDRFECGYVDLGATKRSAQIQPGCSVAFEGRTVTGSGTLQWARAEFVPAGRRVMKDPKWPLANLIATGKEPTARSMESITLGNGRDPGVDPSKRYK